MFAKGRSNIKAERDILFQGFRDQLKTMENALKLQETEIKAQLYDIISDLTIHDEEKNTLKKGLYETLENIEEQHIRIRRSIFIGLYSFWEISLKAICDTPSLTGNTFKPQEKSDKTQSIVRRYLNIIYEEKIPSTASLLNGPIRELRNYMVHGTLCKNQKNTLEKFVVEYPKFCVQISCKDYIFNNYAGLFTLLNIISEELDNAEIQFKILANSKML